MPVNLPFPHQKEILLSKYSTFGIGGAARFFASAHTKEEMQQMLQVSSDLGLRVFILGKGSNTLFDDRGFDGLVILNKIDYLKMEEGEIFRAGSGYSFARLGGITARLGVTGLEFASGIPATVGGAIYMNAGANGQETFDTLLEVGFLSSKGESLNLKKADLQFGYRTSSFQKMEGAIVEGIFQLKPSISAKETQKKILNYRLKTQPYKEKSAGCAFRNPEGEAAGKLIDTCGLKGVSVGGAQVCPLHANFIVNSTQAKAQDVLALIQKVKETVYEQKGVLLEEEIRFVSYDS